MGKPSPFAAALAHQGAGRLAEAEAAYRAVLALPDSPHRADACNNLGVLLNGLGRREEALACLDELARLEPDRPRAQANRGVVLRALGRNEEAVAAYQAALALDARFHSAHNNLGNLHYQEGAYAEALQHFEQAAVLQPEQLEYRFMLAKCLVEVGDLDRAEAELRVVIRQSPGHADALGTLARVWGERHCLPEALAWFDRGVAARPDYAGLIYNRGLSRLLHGDLTGGFADYERRFEVPAFPSKRIATDKPLWDGCADPGLVLLVHAEQGLGDSLQFVRFLPGAAERVGRLIFLVQGALPDVLDLAGNIEVIPEGQPLPAFDRVCALLSLPHLLGITLLDAPGLPYLKLDLDKMDAWAAHFPAHLPAHTPRAALRVGLVWAGNPAHSNDAKRSVPLESLAPLLALEGVEWFSLQMGPRGADLATVDCPAGFIDLSPHIQSFADTAAALQHLDLLICVDTSIAHLAGGLGLPVWLLLPWLPDWRWQLFRDHSPWYPSMKLWRQGRPGDWQGLIADLADELKLQAGIRQGLDSPAARAVRQAVETAIETGRLFLERKEHALAAPLFWRALREVPAHARSATALAVVAFRLNRPDLAVAFGTRACRQDGGEAEQHANLGAYQRASCRPEAALASFAKGLALHPDNPALIYNRGLVRLMLGDWGGFQDYERRFDVADFPTRRLKTDKPLWNGAPLPGRTLLVHAEQGLGDSLQFARYLPQAAERVGRLLVLMQAAVRPVLRLPGNVELLAEDQAIPPYDCCCALLSLPLLLAGSPGEIPGRMPAAPYLVFPEPRPFPGAEKPGLKVGLVWAGNPGHNNDVNRSVPLSTLAPLLALPGIAWYSLQTGPRRMDIEAAGLGDVLVDCGSGLRDFSDTAALLRHLDLLVCVDTSVAHLAGGLGLPVWLMLPHAPDWRWQLGRPDTPWYPGMRLWRQPAHGQWGALTAILAEALGRLLPQAGQRAVATRADAHVDAGCRLMVREDPAAAGEPLWAALREHPFHPQANHVLGVWAYRSGHRDQAIVLAERASRYAPEDAEIRANLGVYLKAAGRYGEARHQLLAAVRLDPKHAGAQSNLGNVYGAEGRWQEALKWAEKAHKLQAANPDFSYNLGIALKENGHYPRALEIFREVQKTAGGHVKAALHAALIELLLGDFERGWADYESRWAQPDCKEVRHFSQPQWQGEPIKGQAILVHAEQGFGDSFQFLRYVPLLVEQGARVSLMVQPGLESLAARMSDQVEIIPSGGALPAFAWHCPLLSLPRAFATRLETIPARVPYIFADPDRVAAWNERLGPARGRRIGLVWAGRPTHGNDANRSMQLAQFEALLNLPDVEILSLQKGPAEAQLANAPGPIRALGGQLESFEDTAAVLSLLDGLVSVDTSVAHLAGALGRPAHVLLPAVPDWRWMLGRTDSPWYPGMKLYRQPLRGDWRTPLEQLLFDLQSAATR
jgi:tetratricopeptide (TPR) repeat protein